MVTTNEGAVKAAAAFVDSLGDQVFFSPLFLKKLFTRCTSFRKPEPEQGVSSRIRDDTFLKRAQGEIRWMEYRRDTARAHVEVLERQVADIIAGHARLSHAGHALQTRCLTASRSNEQLLHMVRRSEEWNLEARRRLQAVTEDTRRVEAYVCGLRKRTCAALTGVRDANAAVLETFRGLTRSMMTDVLATTRPALTLVQCVTAMTVVAAQTGPSLPPRGEGGGGGKTRADVV